MTDDTTCTARDRCLALFRAAIPRRGSLRRPAIHVSVPLHRTRQAVQGHASESRGGPGVRGGRKPGGLRHLRGADLAPGAGSRGAGPGGGQGGDAVEGVVQGVIRQDHSV